MVIIAEGVPPHSGFTRNGGAGTTGTTHPTRYHHVRVASAPARSHGGTQMSERQEVTLPSLFAKVAACTPVTWLTCP